MKKFIKKNLSKGQIKAIQRLLNKPFTIGKRKIFCISMQRTGTTSVGQFLQNHGIRTARQSDSKFYNWGYLWSIGDYNSILKSEKFTSYQAYEDGPWWFPDFYKILNHRFPGAKFILFTRPSEEWFASMVNHSGGKNPGNTFRHCKIYQRMNEFWDRLDNDKSFNPTLNETDNLLNLQGKDNHYRKIYENYNREVIEFFKNQNKGELFVCSLKDKKKWQKLGNFLKIKVNNNYNVHANKSLF